MKFTSLILLSAAVAVQGRTVGGGGVDSSSAVQGGGGVQGIAWETIEDFPTTEFPFDVVDDNVDMFGDEGDDYS